MQQVTTIGLDLAKNLFEVHGADAQGRPVLKRRLAREKVPDFFADLPPCLVGLEACAAAHWRRVSARGRSRRTTEALGARSLRPPPSPRARRPSRWGLGRMPEGTWVTIVTCRVGRAARSRSSASADCVRTSSTVSRCGVMAKSS